jgi:transposase
MMNKADVRKQRRPVRDDGWRLPDDLWARMEPLLPPRPAHPLGCHNPRVPDRAAMDAIFFVLRTGCQWNALNETRICSSSSAHRRFQDWAKAGVFEAFWREGLLAYDGLVGIDWSWMALDAAMGKAPLGGGKNRPQSHGSGQAREQALGAERWARRAARGRLGRGQPQRPQADARDACGDPRAAATADAPAPAASVLG